MSILELIKTIENLLDKITSSYQVATYKEYYCICNTVYNNLNFGINGDSLHNESKENIKCQHGLNCAS